MKITDPKFSFLFNFSQILIGLFFYQCHQEISFKLKIQLKGYPAIFSYADPEQRYEHF